MDKNAESTLVRHGSLVENACSLVFNWHMVIRNIFWRVRQSVIPFEPICHVISTNFEKKAST